MLRGRARAPLARCLPLRPLALRIVGTALCGLFYALPTWPHYAYCIKVSEPNARKIHRFQERKSLAEARLSSPRITYNACPRSHANRGAFEARVT
jgi:hypothetical protein